MLSMSGKLILKPNMAELKHDGGFFFKADPYCVLILGDQQKQTMACKSGGKHPVWDDIIEFDRVTEDILTVQIWDKDLLTSDDFICEGAIGVDILLQPGIQNVCIDLHKKGKFMGKLMMETEFIPSMKPQLFTGGPMYGEMPMGHHHHKF